MRRDSNPWPTVSLHALTLPPQQIRTCQIKLDNVAHLVAVLQQYTHKCSRPLSVAPASTLIGATASSEKRGDSMYSEYVLVCHHVHVLYVYVETSVVFRNPREVNLRTQKIAVMMTVCAVAVVQWCSGRRVKGWAVLFASGTVVVVW